MRAPAIHRVSMYEHIEFVGTRRERSRLHGTHQENSISLKSQGNVLVAIEPTPLWQPDWFVGGYDTPDRNEAT